MLTAIREKIQGWLAYVIIGLLIVPFALWGINYYFEGGGSLNVAEVNGISVPVENYRRALDDQRRSLQQLLGRNADPRLFDTPEFRQRVVDGLIDEILVAADVEAQGYRISDGDLAKQIRQIPQFQRNGEFDAKQYELMVRNIGMDPRSFEQRLQRDVILRQAESGYTQSALVSEHDVAVLLRLQAQTRQARVALLKPGTLRDQVKVDAQAIENEYNRNSEQYKTPERVRIEYLRLSAAELAKTIRVSETELRQAIAEAEAAAGANEARRASHILIPLPGTADAEAEKQAMAKIQSLRAKLLAGGDFASIAREHSKDPGSAKQGGDLGLVARGAMVQEFEQALFALKKTGEVSAPVRTSFGLHLIKLTGLSQSATKLSREKIETEWRTRKADERFYELSEKFSNLVYEHADSLKPAAEVLALPIQTSDWFGRSGAANGIAAEQKIVDAVFDPEVLEQGRNSTAIEIAPNTLVAVRILQHESPRQRTLAEVRAEIESKLRIEAQQQEADRRVQAALDKLKAGESLEAVARQAGMELHAPRTYTRQSPGTDTALLAALFRTSPPEAGKPVYGHVRMNDGVLALFALNAVTQPEKVDTNSADAQAIRRALAARRGQELYESYQTGLRQKATIRIYKDQL